MPTPFTWALVGPGAIAHAFAQAVDGMPDARLGVVLGRDLARAQSFAAQWSAAPGAAAQAPIQATTDWHAVLQNPAVQGVYIATPHAQHAEAIALCLQAGKPVLCEKPLVVNRAQAEPLMALARQQGVFLMEALWTRFLPAYDRAARWLQGGAIGRVQSVQSCFCIHPPYDPMSRLYAPELAGGSLLDTGIYCLSMTRWALQMAQGFVPTLCDLQVHGVLADTGVDRRVAATLGFEGGAVAQMLCGFDSLGNNRLHIHGEQGWIEFAADFWGSQEVILHRKDSAPECVAAPWAINGYEGEIAEAMHCIRRGDVESARLPHAETLDTLGWMDTIRARLGVRYPFE